VLEVLQLIHMCCGLRLPATQHGDAASLAGTCLAVIGNGEQLQSRRRQHALLRAASSSAHKRHTFSLRAITARRLHASAAPSPCCCCHPCCCSSDFPKTGGASLREMASEIGDSISESLGGKSGGPHSKDPGYTTVEGEAATRAVERAKSK
jgi:hypothetical protein